MNIDSDDSCWETVWPPECIDDEARIKAMIAFIDTQLSLHAIVWTQMTNSQDKLGIHEESVLEDLIAKSGNVSKPFIDLSLLTIAKHVGTRRLANLLQSILLKPVEDEQIDMKLYKGCVWELTASFVTLLIHACDSLSPKCVCQQNPPASCYQPTDRLVYIRTFLAR